MYQKTIVVGNVGRDPEMRYTSEGIGVCSFSVAANTGYGERQKTTWFRVTAWRNLAETCSQYVRQGMLVLVEGTIEARPYTTGAGEGRVSLELTADNVRFLSRTGDATPNRTDLPNDDTNDIPF